MEKSLALMQHLGLPYFQIYDSYFQGTEEEAKEDYSDYWVDPMSDTFEEWCKKNCLLVEEDYTDIDDDYLVFDDEEAREKAKIYISESVWAFNAYFIVNHSNMPNAAVEMIESFQSAKCEDANETILALIEDFDEFVSDAISADGRGHFLGSYDGEENEETVNGETYYIYRN